MANVLEVTLVPAGAGWAIDIDEKDHGNEVPRGPNPQLITWKLAGNAYSDGQFIDFAWADEPPDDTFSGPDITPAGKHLKIYDLNNKKASTGAWRYRLTIEVAGVKYRSGLSSSSAGAKKKGSVAMVVTTNPTIVNK